MQRYVEAIANHGSQAIRLPAKLRLQSKEVQIEQIGDALWLMPQTGVKQDMGQWLTAFYANTEPLPDDFLNDRKDLPLQERDLSKANPQVGFCIHTKTMSAFSA